MELGRTFSISLPKFPTPDPTTASWLTSAAASPIAIFYIRDEVLGPIILRVASFFPFHATYWLNGHCFIKRELTKAGIGFHKNDNAFLAVDDAAALPSAADRLSPAIIRKQLDYWTFILKLHGKLATVIEQIEPGHRVFRVNFKTPCSDRMRSSPAFSATNCYRTI